MFDIPEVKWVGYKSKYVGVQNSKKRLNWFSVFHLNLFEFFDIIKYCTLLSSEVYGMKKDELN